VDQSASQVVVQLDGKEGQDAHAVFGVLRTAFPSDRPADDVKQKEEKRA